MSQISIFELARTKPVIRFKKLVEDQEGYAEEGIMARLVSVSDDGDGVVKVTVTFKDFEDHNKNIETPNWNKGGETGFTAREAGFYREVDSVWIEGKNWPEMFEVVSSPVLEAFAAREDKSVGYVAWLENIAANFLLEKNNA